jgi:hypothetical protein
MYECDNCNAKYEREDRLKHVFPDIPDLLVRIEPGGTVPAGECPGCGALVYPVKESTVLTALRHAYDRLNSIPHRYADTDFALIRRALEEAGPTRLLVLVEGGLVQEVLSDGPGVEVAVLNQDLEGADEDEVEDLAGDGYDLRGTLQAHEPAIAPELIAQAWRPVEQASS